MTTFELGGQRIAYTEHGAGPRTTVLMHGLLLSQRMHEPLAEALAERGHRVITLDLLGHGASDRPPDMWRYSMPQFAEQVVALLDELGIDEAVIGGTSLGANVALETAALAPERVRGMVIEMPVLDGALVACAIAFSPLLIATTIGLPFMRALSWGARAIPEGTFGWLGDVALDTVRQDPRPSGAVLQGLFFGRVAPHRDIRRTIAAPALVIGHDRDPVHPFSDSDALVSELPDARLLRADSFFELRMTPERLTCEIAGFQHSSRKPRRKTRSAAA